MRIRAKTFEQYLKQIPEERREVVEQLTKIIKEELPGVEVVIHWGVPLFRKNGYDIIALAVQKYYYSIYLWTMDWQKKYSKALKKLNIGKGCIRFKKLDQIPDEILRDIIRQAGKRD